ncbi:MAG: VOC family protein [Blastocatellia bacterium]|nr:VOC family protein [Blastocatellia bacterium]
MLRNAEKKSTPKKGRSIPEGYGTVTPFVITRNSSELLDFLRRAFGARELYRFISDDGSIDHAETRIGDSVVMMFDKKDGWPDTPSYLRLYVEDCDALYQKAIAAGATPMFGPINMPWGDRSCRVRDPLGNYWAIMTRIENLSPEEERKRWGQKEYIDAMEYAKTAPLFPV